jgi:hypothetical protein
MNIPSDPSLAYVAIILFLSGFFLFIAGLDIIKVEKITVARGAKTWVLGVVLMATSLALGLAIQRGTDVPATVTTAAPQESTVTTSRPAAEDTSTVPPATRTEEPTTSSKPSRVKYTNLAVGDELFTRGCKSEGGRYWINSFQAMHIDSKGIVWGSFERAETANPGAGTFNYLRQNQGQPLNLSETCVSGGCYVKESYAVADLQRWQAQGCPW